VDEAALQQEIETNHILTDKVLLFLSMGVYGRYELVNL